MRKYATDDQTRGNTKAKYEVTAADLPLSCPLPKFRLWDSHPRVYLPIEETGHAVCPYCDAEYVLIKQNET